MTDPPDQHTEVFPVAKLESAYDTIAQTYDDKRETPYWALWDHLTKRTAMACMPAPPARVLDAGAGTGAFSGHLLERGYKVVLLDPSKGMLERAQAKIVAKGLDKEADYVEGKLEDLSVFPDASFDFVFSDGDPLSYCIGAQQQAAREVMRVLRPGGGFYVSCDSRWTAVLLLTAWGKIEEAKRCAENGDSKDPYGNPVHAFTPEELEDLFKDAGAVGTRVTGKISIAHRVQAPMVNVILGHESAHKPDYLRYEEMLSDTPSAAAFASHLQITGKKPEETD